MVKHIVQSSEWGEFKNNYGTPAIEAGGVLYTKHKIPFTPYFYAYCPRVNPSVINFEILKESLHANSCVSVNFDVPNVIAGSKESTKATDLFLAQGCVKASRDQFAKSNVLLDLQPAEEELLVQMHNKHRYNIQYSQKKGVKVYTAEDSQTFSEFYTLYKETADRQKYFARSDKYCRTLWDLFKPKGMAEILTAKYNGKALASWMFLISENVLYYVYGGSSEDLKNLHASNLVAWEGMLLGKQRGCTVFDMWGASENPNDTNDSWWGFTNFKLKFGGTYVKYIDSYDLVLNEPMYKMFTAANAVRWKLLRLMA